MVVSAKGSPELSSECIPDVNRVLPATAGHTETDRNTEAPRCERKGRKPTDPPSPLSLHLRGTPSFPPPETPG